MRNSYIYITLHRNITLSNGAWRKHINDRNKKGPRKRCAFWDLRII